MKKILTFFILLAITFTACKKFEDLEKDPNRPGEVPPSLIFTSVLRGTVYDPWSAEQRWNQFWCSNYAYYDDQEYDWMRTYFNYLKLNDVKQMVAEAERIGLPEVNAYSALAKFFKAYYFIDMSMRLGDLPLTEALQGLDNIAPKYNTQKEVFLQSLTWLEEANSDLQLLIDNNDKILAGDFMLGNDLVRWQKVVNTFKLRTLIALSKKESDADLNIKQLFADVVGNPGKYPVMLSLDDNLSFVFNNSTDKYPLNPDNYGFTATRNNMSATYLNTLVLLRDPRTFIVAEPALKKLEEGYTAADYEAYVGASSGESLDDMSAKMLAGEYSAINKAKYYGTYTGEPAIQIGYIELCFNIAEAISRGWISGNAEEFYKNGIQASWTFHGVNVLANWEDYYAQSVVAYKGDNAEGLNQILTQKYLGFFQNSGWEAYYNNRRTGVPEFLTGVGTGNSGRIAKRWMYPQSEPDYNTDNNNDALMNQFGSETDDINAEMWLIK
ncbi:MAG: SusD/RagB family nutrient-binding outer membrane lipoprotein [Bacteroidales bacterium]|nr:SusD/RagB family nutrient-binding outer membrane lipoprotein [Bacteroidales bacterium]